VLNDFLYPFIKIYRNERSPEKSLLCEKSFIGSCVENEKKIPQSLRVGAAMISAGLRHCVERFQFEVGE
jgi:hypothetical protein